MEGTLPQQTAPNLLLKKHRRRTKMTIKLRRRRRLSKAQKTPLSILNTK